MKKNLLILSIIAIGFLTTNNLQAQPTWFQSFYQLNTYTFGMTDNGYIFASSGQSVKLSTTDGSAYSFNLVTGTFPTSGYQSIMAKGNLVFVSDDDYINYHGRGIYMTSDFGATWVAKNNGLGADTNVRAIYLMANGALLAYTETMTSGKLFRSTNNGTSWSFLQNQPTVYDIKVRSATEAYMCSNGNVYKSTDNGLSWTIISSSYVYKIVITSTGTFYGIDNYTIQKSTDNAVTWTTVTTTGLPVGIQFGAFLRAPGDTIYCGNIASPYGLYYSTNGCANWNPCMTGLGTGPQILRDNLTISKGGYLFAGPSGSGVYRSVNRITASTAGIEENQLPESAISIYPNPSHGKIQIESSDLKVENLEIYNMQGLLLKNFAVNDKATTIDISTLASGMYFIKAKTEKGVVVKKFIIE